MKGLAFAGRYKRMLQKIISFFMSIIFFFAALLGAPVKTDKSIVYKDLEYGKDERQVVDLCIPKDVEGEVNLFLGIHGGGWVAGDKSGYFDSLEGVSNAYGICTAAMNYHYISDKTHNEDIMNDVTACLKKIKETAAKHGITVNKVILSGGSAGGHISMQYAYTKAQEAPITPVAVISYSGPTDMTDEAFYINNSLGDSETVSTLFSYLSGYNFTYAQRAQAAEALKAVSPLYCAENAVPTVICHGACDTVVPFSNAVALDAKLTEYGIKHDFVIYPNSNHGLESDPESAAVASELFTEYINTYLK